MIKNRIVLMAGGTGGHVFPALAIAEALREQGFAVCWLGTQAGLEARVVPAAGIDIEYIRIHGIRSKGCFTPCGGGRVRRFCEWAGGRGGMAVAHTFVHS